VSAPPAVAGGPITFQEFIAMGRVSDPRITPDGKHVAFVVTRYSLETNAGNGDIFMVPIGGGGARQLTNWTGADKEPRFSPDGRSLAFTSTRSGDAQIWVLPLDGGEARQLTSLSTGASGPQWTPDGRHVLFTSSVYPDCADDAANRARLEQVAGDKCKARVIDELLYVHWDSWRDERRSHVFIVPASGGEPRDLTPVEWDVPTLTLGSAHDVAVSPDGAEVCVVANTEKNAAWSTNNDLFIVPADGGEWKRITDNPANDNHPVYSPDGRYIAYRAMSRPGFESDRYRLMLYDRNSGAPIELGTELSRTLDRSVGGVVWSPDSRRVYVTAEDEGYTSLYEVDSRSAKTRRLIGGHTLASVAVSPDGKTLVFLDQNAAMPYEVFASDANGRNPRKITRVNDDALGALDMNRLESFTFSGAGGTPVQGWILKPPGFDASRKYPLTFLVHGGPQGAWGDDFHWRWNYQMFAARGRVVVAINPRGSTGFGQEFTDGISRDWGGRVYEDLMNGLDYVLATYPFVDGERMAAAGASYGGYMVDWFLGHTDRFRCLVSHDGTYNLESMYGATEELWFPEWEFGGTPWDNPGDYEKWSPHKYAANFNTPTLVVHGALDFRVPLNQSTELFTALQRRGVASRFLYFPDEGHWVLKPVNARLWWQTVLDWIDEYSR
jgi:dipeptidyl aminopeptidase/acylaminoacyl peptidase